MTNAESRSTGKSLSPERIEGARTFMRQVVAEDFADNISAAARALGLSTATISDMVAGKGGVGAKVIEALADHRGVSMDRVVGRDVPAPHAPDEDEPASADAAPAQAGA